MLAMTLASQRVVIPRMDALRAQMGSVHATAASDPLRAGIRPPARHVGETRKRSAAAWDCVAVFFTVEEVEIVLA